MGVENLRTPVIKAANVTVGEAITIGSIGEMTMSPFGNPFGIGIRPWSIPNFEPSPKVEVPQAFQSALADVTLDPFPELTTPRFDILSQANQIAEAAWEKTDPAPYQTVLGPAQLFYENNVRLLSIMPIFNPQSAPYQTVLGLELNAADAVSEAESILAAAAKPKVGSVEAPPVFREALLDVNLDPQLPPVLFQAEKVAEKAWNKSDHVVAEPVVLPAVEPKLAPAQKESTSTPKSGSLLQAYPIRETKEHVEQVEEQMEVKSSQEPDQEEEVIKDQRRYVEDGEAAAQRRFEIRQAIAKAKTVAAHLSLKKIPGTLVALFLPAEHEGNRSQVVKQKGPDGSYQETVEAISLTGEFESEFQARERFDAIVAEKKPVRKAQVGKMVTLRELIRVFKYHLIKPVAVYQVWLKRIIRKGAVVEEETKVQTGSSIEDYPELNSVFDS